MPALSVNEALLCTVGSNTSKSTQNQKHPQLTCFLCDSWQVDKSFRSLLFTHSFSFEFKQYQPPSITEKAKFKKAMDLLDAAVSTDVLTVLCNKESGKQQIFDAFENLISAALQKLSKWEGKLIRIIANFSRPTPLSLLEQE